MHGSVARKLLRLAGSLAAHPAYALRYARRGPLSRRSPLELGLPWFSEAAIDFLERHLQPGMAAFEWGSGGSTVFLASRVRTVVTVENNADWVARVQHRLALAGCTNVTLLHHPFDFVTARDFLASGYLHAIDGVRADVIIVDGEENDIPVRPECFFRAEGQVREGGIIVVDDAWRYPEIRTRSRAKMQRIFQSTGPCRPGVTSTDVHFY